MARRRRSEVRHAVDRSRRLRGALRRLRRLLLQGAHRPEHLALLIEPARRARRVRAAQAERAGHAAAMAGARRDGRGGRRRGVPRALLSRSHGDRRMDEHDRRRRGRSDRAARVPRARPARDGRRGGAGMKGLVNSVAYADGLRIGEVAIPDISEVLKQSGRFVWVGLHEPDEEMLAEIQQEFSLHDLAVEDAARAHQRPKLERYGDSIFVVLRTAHVDDSTGGIDFGETHIFVGANYVVSVRHGGSLPYVDVRSRCEANPDLLIKGPGFVLYALMDFIVDQYFPLVDRFED